MTRIVHAYLLLLSSLISSYCLSWTPKSLLVKTKETFKLADVFFLEARLQSENSGYGCRRILTDTATGSSLLELNIRSEVNYNGWFMNRHQKNSTILPSSLRRSDWVAEVISNETTAADLIESLKASDNALADLGLWTMTYLRMTSSQHCQDTNSPRGFSRTSLLCAAAQSIKAPAALDPTNAEDSLIVLEADDRFYFLKVLLKQTSTLTSRQLSDCKGWSRRPFAYSSAINPMVADILVDLLKDSAKARVVVADDNHPDVWLLDPTCGSGAFLAAGLLRGLKTMGWDDNPTCVEGCKSNLVFLHGADRVSKDCVILVRDSSLLIDCGGGGGGGGGCEDEFAGISIDCVVCNLPWGLNTVKYVEENERILRGVRSALAPGIPCAFVSKDSFRDLEAFGYRHRGEAPIPQANFRLPKGSKRKMDLDDSDRGTSAPGTGRNACVVTFAETI